MSSKIFRLVRCYVSVSKRCQDKALKQGQKWTQNINTWRTGSGWFLVLQVLIGFTEGWAGLIKKPQTVKVTFV